MKEKAKKVESKANMPAVVAPSGPVKSRGSRAPSGYNPPEESVLNETTCFVVEEVTEGVNPGFTAADAVEMRAEGDGLAFNTGREPLDPAYMDSSFSRKKPGIGQISDDAGPSIGVFLRGPGSAADVDFEKLLKAAMGIKSTPTPGTINVTPTPTIEGFTLSTGSVVVGDIIKVGNDYTKIKTEAAGAVTVFPYLSATPVGGETVDVYKTYKLTSDNSLFKTLSAIFEFTDDKQLIFVGCRPGFTVTYTVGERIPLDFVLTANDYEPPSNTARTTPTFQNDSEPPVALGIVHYGYQAGTVGAGATTSVIPVVSDPADLLDLVVGERVYIDVAGAWETDTIQSISGLDITLTTGLSGAPAEGQDLIIRKQICNDSFSVNLEMQDERVKCMSSTSGTKLQKRVGRNITFTKSKHFESWYELLARDNVVGEEIWCVAVGPGDNNTVVLNLTNAINQAVTIGTETLMMQSIDGIAVQKEVSDDELFIGIGPV